MLIMKPITLSLNKQMIGSSNNNRGLAQTARQVSPTGGVPDHSLLRLDRLLSIMPRRLPQAALDIHLLLYPLNVLRLTDAFFQAVMLLPDGVVAAVLDARKPWPSLFAMPCIQARTCSGDYRVRVAWQIRAIEEQVCLSLNCKYLIMQWAKVVRKLQHGQSCLLLGLHHASGIGVRPSASQAANELIRTLPDLLDHLSKAGISGDVGGLPDAMLALHTSIRIVLKDAACVPLYEELSEFVLSPEEFALAFAVAG